LFNPVAKTETLVAAGNATSSAALPSAALVVPKGTEHASASAIRRKLHRKGDRPIDFFKCSVFIVFVFSIC
jgi:hypothetical protein